MTIAVTVTAVHLLRRGRYITENYNFLVENFCHNQLTSRLSALGNDEIIIVNTNYSSLAEAARD